MVHWRPSDTFIVRNIARSDGTVTTAVPAIVISDNGELLALYIAVGTSFKNNWVVPPEERAAAVHNITPSAQRQYRDLIARTDSIRLYLSGHSYSVGLTFDEDGAFVSWYGNLEAPFIRTNIGLDTRDFALDVIATPDGQWRWKDEEEFQRRLELGVDSPEHQAKVRAAGLDFIDRFERMSWPFNAGWERWRPAYNWQFRHLPPNWADDFGTHALLSAAIP